MAEYSFEEMTDIHFIYGKANGCALKARKLYQEAFPNRQLPSFQFFSQLHQGLKETGTFLPGHIHCAGRAAQEDSKCGTGRVQSAAASSSAGNGTIATFPEIKRFVLECMGKVGTTPENAKIFSECIIDADIRGHTSHGLNRLTLYVNDIRDKIMNANGVPEILKETASAAAVEGHNGLGSVVSHWCMNLAIKKAEETGVGIVSVKGSNHFGLGQTYVMSAIKKGMIGMVFTNTSPAMVPTRAKKTALGTNPITVGCPGLKDDIFMVDVATTVVSVGKIDIYRRKGLDLPEAWAMNPDGQSESNSEEAMKHKLLYPLGGYELNAGYKGFALGLMVEMFSGILSGGSYGPSVRKWGDRSGPLIPANLGQCFIAINPKFFADGFQERMQDIMNILRNMEPVDPEKPVLIPGDFERNNMKNNEKQGGIVYDAIQLKQLNDLAESLGVAPLKLK